MHFKFVGNQIFGFICCGIIRRTLYFNSEYLIIVDRFDGKKIGVRLLEHDRNNDEDTKHIDFKVLRVIKHKGYSPTSYNNDIALLRMDTDGVEFGPSTGLHPVCMPAEGMTYSYSTHKTIEDRIIRNKYCGRTERKKKHRFFFRFEL